MIPEQTTYKPLFITANRRLGDGGINPVGRQASSGWRSNENHATANRKDSEIFRGFQAHFRTLHSASEHSRRNRAGRVPAAEPKESVA